MRDASLGHQLLLALGRVVSTKVYLSSKGVDVVAKQHGESWRRKFLQQGMSGTAIVYGNGSADDAMESFPPSDAVLQDSFMAVFTGPEREAAILTPEQQAVFFSFALDWKGAPLIWSMVVRIGRAQQWHQIAGWLLRVVGGRW